MTTAPVIEGRIVRLRPHRREDFDACAVFYAAEESRFMGGPLDARGAWFSFASDVAQWALYGHGAWAIEPRDAPVLAGQVTLNAPPFFPEPELGWLLFPRGRGLATEAVELARTFARERLGWWRLVSYVRPENTAAARLATRLGAFLDASAKPLDPSYRVYRHRMAEAGT